MIPLKLYIEDFFCHKNSYIDFSLFRSALIVGRIENNDNYSNGVGKTTIFRAIEFVLFNYTDTNLEKIIRDNTDCCKITFDFMIDDKEYRLSRSRTKKGSSDLSLYERNAVQGLDNEVYHVNDIPVINKKYWKDISGRRATDTENILEKLIKINIKSFRNTVHFVQNDFSGFATSTPEKRKALLKEALTLAVYSKLEKIAKDKSNTLSKEINRNQILIDNLGNPSTDLILLNNNLPALITSLNKENEGLSALSIDVDENLIILNNYKNEYSSFEKNISIFKNKENLSLSEKSKIEQNINEYKIKKANINNIAKNLIEEIKQLKEQKQELSTLDFLKIELLNNSISSLKDSLSICNANIKTNTEKLEELNIPVPDDNFCKHCRQQLTEEHKNICKKQITDEINLCKKNISLNKNEILNINKSISEQQKEMTNLKSSKQKLDNIETKIVLKEQEYQDKKSLFQEYSLTLTKLNKELELKNQELSSLSEELNNMSSDKMTELKNKITSLNNLISKQNIEKSNINKNILKLTNDKAVIEHSIKQKENDLKKKQELLNLLKEKEKEYSIYPHVIQAFSSTGIPNLIIQNVLDDFQIETNNILNQLKPGLQLSFFVEKTKTDGTQDDTLDILYYINGCQRDYDQLSGAMKLAVNFSLKLGLSFILQKIIGTDVKFLLLDEIDQSLDKASVDAFADIVKLFEKDFSILVITHNDYLKNKFSNGILVQQDINMISTASVISSW